MTIDESMIGVENASVADGSARKSGASSDSVEHTDLSFPIERLTLAHVQLGVFLLGIVWCGVARGNDWEFIEEKDQIKSYRSTTKKDGLFGFRGEAIMKVNIGQIVTLLFNPPVRPETYTPMLFDWAIVKEALPYGGLLWQHYRQPWPISDRDFALSYDGASDKQEKTFRVGWTSVNDPQTPPQSCCIRAELRSSYVFRALPDGTTRVEAEVRLDPKGLLPKWLVNSIQRSWAHDTILAAEKQATKCAVDPRFAGWHAP